MMINKQMVGNFYYSNKFFHYLEIPPIFSIQDISTFFYLFLFKKDEASNILHDSDNESDDDCNDLEIYIPGCVARYRNHLLDILTGKVSNYICFIFFP